MAEPSCQDPSSTTTGNDDRTSDKKHHIQDEGGGGEGLEGGSEEKTSVASFTSLDAEETVRTRGAASAGARPSVFDVFGEIRSGNNNVETEVKHHETAIVFDGLHRVRALSNQSTTNAVVGSSSNSIGAAYCDPPLPRPHHHHNEPSMNDLAFLMREQDADLLESIHLKAANDDSGETPLLSSSDGANAAAVPNLALEQAASLEMEGSALSTTAVAVEPSATSTLASTTGGGAPPALSSLSRQRSSKPASLRTILLRHESGGGGSTTSAAGGEQSKLMITDDLLSVGTDGERSRKALSGEIWVMPDEITMTTTTTTTAAVEPPSTPSKAAETSPFSISVIAEDEEMIPTRPSSKSASAPIQLSPKLARLVRSESHDRRLNEAAQFAEAVGDLRPSERDELRIIEEDHDVEGAYDTDDDDDATEIHVEGIDDTPKRKVVIELEGLPVEVSILHPHKVRPQWPFKTKRTKGGFLDQLPENGSTTQDFVYKGIRANPPEIVSRGVTRGNYSCLHRKAWLECTDKYHRYGKNLRLYYRFWERLGFPTNMFFDWLDSKGEAAGEPLPELDECPRAQLDSDTVLYIVDEQETRGYSVHFIVDESGRAVVLDVDNELVKTGPEGWIFVLRDNVMYGAQKITSVKGHCKQRFHHSSFFGGKAVAAAGIFITDENGVLQQVLPHSGHYRPGEAHMQRMLFFLHNQGVDLWSFQVDMQQILHVARDTEGTEKVEKKKKTETLRLTSAGLVACYLAHKARFIGEGIFSQIHRIKKADVATVTEALELIDDGSTGRTSVKEADTSQ